MRLRKFLSSGVPFSIMVSLLAFTASPPISRALAAQTAAAQNPATAPSGLSPADVWNDAAGELGAKILQHAASGSTLALTVKNLSSLSDDEVAVIRRSLRAQLRSGGARLTASRQANVDVQVTLSENVEAYLWVAEIHEHTNSNAPAEGVVNSVAMVSVARPKPGERLQAAETLTIRKRWIYQQPEPILDAALLSGPPGGGSTITGPAGAGERLLVLGLDSVSLYEEVEVVEGGGPDPRQWRLVQSNPITPVRQWPRDARGRIILLPDGLFDVFLPGVECSGGVAPAFTLDCHAGDEPWPLAGTMPAANTGASSGGTMPAAYFTADRNLFDGRVELGNGRQIKTPPFLSLGAVPLAAAARAGLPLPAPRAQSPAAAPAGWVLTGIDGRGQILNYRAEPLATVSGWGSQIAGVLSGCGTGWQVLASRTGDSTEPDAVQAYEIANRKPVPASNTIEFAGPVTELWPWEQGTEALAIARNLQTGSYEAYRISVECGH